jgi:hypothetical protein
MEIDKLFDTYDLARFFSRVEVKKQPRCWIYKGSIANDGYPSFSLRGKSIGGHRFSYLAFHGPIPEGLVIRHTCDNPKCVNPYHLETGTHQENMLDKVLRNRTVKGDKNGRSVLTEDQVRRIVEDGRTYKELANEYNVCTDTIKNILTGRNWSHVTGIRRKKR